MSKRCALLYAQRITYNTYCTVGDTPDDNYTAWRRLSNSFQAQCFYFDFGTPLPFSAESNSLENEYQSDPFYCLIPIPTPTTIPTPVVITTRHPALKRRLNHSFDLQLLKICGREIRRFFVLKTPSTCSLFIKSGRNSWAEMATFSRWYILVRAQRVRSFEETASETL